MEREMYCRVLSAAACATGTRQIVSSTASMGQIATSEARLSARMSSHPRLRINSKCGWLKVSVENVDFCFDCDYWLVLNSDYIDILTAPYLPIPDVTSPNMKRFIYKSVPHQEKLGKTPLDICSILDPVESLECEMMFMTDTHCHFGNSSIDDSANLSLEGTSWDVNIKPGRWISSDPDDTV